MYDNSVEKRVFEKIPDITCGRGRHKLKCKYSIIEDYNKIGINISGKIAAIDRPYLCFKYY